MNILLAEDNYTHKVLLTHILVSECKVKVQNIKFAVDGNQAMEELEKSLKNETKDAFDLIIIDYCIPIMSGLNVIKNYAKECKRLNKPQCVAVLVSAYTREYFENLNLKSNGVNFFQNKPVGVNELQAILKIACNS
jgi:CheY-like chemotaxis protein